MYRPKAVSTIPCSLLLALVSGCMAVDEAPPTDLAPAVDLDQLSAGADEPPGVLHWETESADDESNSTHLWIVNRAIDILANHPDVAGTVHDLLTYPSCRSRWQQGLIDADYKAPYHDGYFDLSPGASEWLIALSGATWESHFYDPDTGENYRGNTSPVAKDRALEHAANAEAWLAVGSIWYGCYELGLSLHYMTDITQPMHTANYAATDWPLRLHGHLEGYAMEVQNNFVRSDWSGVPPRRRARLVQATAHASKALWPVMLGAIEDAYDANCDPFDEYWFDHEDCWEGDAAVDAAVGASLWAAQDATARYLATFQ